MKSIIFFIIIISLSHGLAAQSTKTLDSHNGFRSFVLGDDIKKYDGKLINGIIKSNETAFIYVASDEEGDLYSVFDQQMDSIRLHFNQSSKQLVGIELIKYYPTSRKGHYAIALEDNKKIMKGFLGLFGNKIGEINRKEPTEDFGVFWLGERVTLNAYTTKLRRRGSANVVSFYSTSFYQK